MPKRKGDREKMFRDFSKMKPGTLKANYLKNFDLAVKNTIKTQSISYAEMMFMLFIYDYEFFTIDHIHREYRRSYMKLEIRLLYPLLKRGYIYKHFDKLSPVKHTRTISSEMRPSTTTASGTHYPRREGWLSLSSTGR